MYRIKVKITIKATAAHTPAPARLDDTRIVLRIIYA